jgi:hypothetical protein
MYEPTTFWYQKAVAYALDQGGLPLEKFFQYEDKQAFFSFKAISKEAGLNGEEIELALNEFKKRKAECKKESCLISQNLDAVNAHKKLKNQVVWNDPGSMLKYLQSQKFYVLKYKPNSV